MGYCSTLLRAGQHSIGGSCMWLRSAFCTPPLQAIETAALHQILLPHCRSYRYHESRVETSFSGRLLHPSPRDSGFQPPWGPPWQPKGRVVDLRLRREREREREWEEKELTLHHQNNSSPKAHSLVTNPQGNDHPKAWVLADKVLCTVWPRL